MTRESPNLAKLLFTLCQIESVIGQEKAICDHLETQLSSIWPCKRIGHNLVFCEPRASETSLRPQVFLLGHLDTVARSTAVTGRPDPTGVRIEGDRLYGLGASDMKAGLAVMAALMQTFDTPSLRAKLPFDLCFVYYAREEGPFLENGLIELLNAEPLKSRLLAEPEKALAIFLEPTGNQAELGCLGTLHAEVTFHGRSAHSAKPWLGKNAIQSAGPLLCALAAREPVDRICDGFLYRESMSATIAHGGRSRNAIPDEFTVNINHRFAPSTSLEEAMQHVKDVVAANSEDTSVRFTDLCPSARSFLDATPVKQLIAALGLEIRAKQAWTDVARLAHLQVPSINFGPGDPSEAHQPGESASLAAMEHSFSLLKRYLSHSQD